MTPAPFYLKTAAAHADTHRQIKFALAVFVINITVCLIFFNPEVQGYGDAIRGWNQFNNFLAGGEPIFSEENQIATRIGMAMITLAILFLLTSLNLIEKRVLVTYLALPFSAYLATKLKLEFLFFPLYLVSTRLGWKKEIMVILAIIGLSLYIGENNGFIIVVFRLANLAFSRIKLRTYWVLIGIGIITFFDYNIQLLYPIVPQLISYDWTRNIVNPEFSHIETLIVFMSSMVLGIQPSLDFYLGIPYTMFILAIAFGKKIFSRRFYQNLLRNSEFRAGVLTVVLFTSLTHAFQNARYYFFYLPSFTSGGGNKVNAIIILTSIPMTVGMALLYRFVLGVN